MVNAILLQADARALPLADNTVDLIITSPPYWKLRDYRDGDDSLAGQIGNEPTPRDYIAALLACTAEWARVLKPTGSMFVNLGDKYANRTRGSWRGSSDGYTSRATSPDYVRPKDLPEKSLMLLPERYRIGAVDELGLIARSVIVWDKPSAMPESVTDRVRRSHEDWVHFTKQPQYFAAVDEIREPHRMKPQRRPNGHRTRQKAGVFPAQTYSTSQRDEKGVDGHPLGALPGSVWEIATTPLKVPDHVAHAHCCDGAKRAGCTRGLGHYAAFPFEWPRQLIQGWSPSGICMACDQPRTLIMDTSVEGAQPTRRMPGAGRDPFSRHGQPDAGSTLRGRHAHRRVGYACACPTPDAPVRPAVVLDPFGGTGTTAMVASLLGRIGISVELSAGYNRIASWRITDPRERARALALPTPPPEPEGHPTLFDGMTA
ncbi:DNA-methyltransferase [Nonomuraea fuscirosea]|uniref:DNA-methyltransferase n=1 Tax=Nonomuraea fuscirosea TaxID=1291556 RepID=UPI00371909E0